MNNSDALYTQVPVREIYTQVPVKYILSDR